MKAKVKEILFVFTVLVWGITPAVLMLYEKKEERELFQILDQDYERCLSRATEDSRDTEWCGQINRSAKLALRAARGNELLLIVIWGPMLLAVFVSNHSLKKQIEELKQKDNA